MDEERTVNSLKLYFKNKIAKNHFYFILGLALDKNSE